MSHDPRPASTTIMLLLVAALAGCSRDAHPPNVVVIGIDTLRADHLGCYGYARSTSPRLDAFAAEAVRFTTAMSPAPWTLPAFASIFTGLLPSHHQAGLGSPDAGWTSLGPEPATLAAVLRGAGYRTGAFVSNEFVAPDTGLARGFEQYDPPMPIATAVSSAVQWIHDHAQERFFVFLHLVDPHQPYAPPTADVLPFLDPNYLGPIGVSFEGAADPSWTVADRRRIVDLYDGEVHYADRLVGRVLDALGDLGLTDRTIVVVTADHGEELFDHQALGHGHTVYDELLHVPLLVRLPGVPPRAVSAQVRTFDVMPTIIDALGLALPAGLDGTSLLPFVRGAAPPPTLPALAEYVFWFDEQKAVRLPTEKLIVTPKTGRFRLFDLARDPEERFDVAAERPERVDELLAEIDRHLLSQQDGVHVVVRGLGPNQQLHVELETSGRLQDVRPMGFAASDEWRLSPDGRRLTFALRGRAATHVGTVQSIAFSTGGAPVSVQSLVIDGRPVPDDHVSPARTDLAAHALVLRTDPDAPATRYPIVPPAAPDGAPVVALQLVRRPTVPVTGLDPGRRERLRALGYLH